MANVDRKIVFQPSGVVAQNFVEINTTWWFKKRGH
ncbi:LCI fold-containing protein [Vibrio mimicus]